MISLSSYYNNYYNFHYNNVYNAMLIGIALNHCLEYYEICCMPYSEVS